MFKILFILHLPPPVHGASMMGKYLHDSKLINETFECKYINLTTAKSLQDIGKNSINKLWTFIRLLTKIILWRSLLQRFYSRTVIKIVQT